MLVTGAAGFIGSHFVRHLLENRPDCTIAVWDALTYAGNRSTMADFADRVQFHEARIEDQTAATRIVDCFEPDAIVNFAAETHNDRSILDSGSFIQTNTFGVHVLLNTARELGVSKVVHVSTDEVYGSIASGQFTEDSPLEPNTPYAASKGGGDLLARAHFTTFKTPVVVTRGGNNYGPYQFPEKLIPFFATRLIDGKKVPLYGDGSQSREWIHVRDHCSAIDVVLQKGKPGEVYNIGDDNEHQNREVVAILLEETGRDRSFVKSIPDPRAGAHDLRYSMATKKIRALGWNPKRDFKAELRNTVRWYLANESWWRPITERIEYQDFVKRFYGPGLGADL